MFAVNSIAPKVEVLSSSPEKKMTHRSSSQSNSKSPKKSLRPPSEKPNVEVSLESPLIRNKNSNTMRQVHVNIKPKQTELQPVTNIIQKK